MISCVPASSENSFAHLLHFQYASYPIPIQVGAFFSTFLRAWPFAFIFTGLLISIFPASSENSFAQFLHLQYASCPVSVQPASFFSTFLRSWPFAFIFNGLLISIFPASSENSFAQFLHFQYASYPFFVHVGACAAWYKFSCLLESFSPYSIPHSVQTAFLVQVAVPPVWLQLYWHTLQIPFSHSCKAHPSCACGSSFTGHASSVHWYQWYVALKEKSFAGVWTWKILVAFKQ